MSAEHDPTSATTTSALPPQSPPDGVTDGSKNLFAPVTAPIDLRGTPDGPPQWPVERGPLPGPARALALVAVEAAQQSSNPWMEPAASDQYADQSPAGRRPIDPRPIEGYPIDGYPIDGYPIDGYMPGQDLIARGGAGDGSGGAGSHEAGLAVLHRVVRTQAVGTDRDGERARDPDRAVRLRRGRIRALAFMVVLLLVGALLAWWVDVRRDASSALVGRTGVVRGGDSGPTGPTPDGGPLASPVAPVVPGPGASSVPVAPSDLPAGAARTALPTGGATSRPARPRPSVVRPPGGPGTSAAVDAPGRPAVPRPAASERALPQYSEPVERAPAPAPAPVPDPDPGKGPAPAPAPEPDPEPVRTRSGSAEVPADAPGVAGIEVRDGGTVTLTARGAVLADRPGEDEDGCVGVTRFDPDGERSLVKGDQTCQPLLNADRAVAPSEPVGALLVRVGGGPWRLAGSERTFRVREGGRLRFAVNLRERAGTEGAFDVSYQVTDPS